MIGGLPWWLRAKNLSSMQQTLLQALILEDPLEKGITIQFSILDWEIPMTEELGRLQPIQLQKSDTT